MTESEINNPPCPSCGYPSGAGHAPDCSSALKSESERSSEVLKPVGFIQEATLPETLEQIAKIPTEKRRIIVYVGVHPNEGTDRLVKGHATEWMEKYGVLVVSQPMQETPHGIWDRHKKETAGDTSIPLSPGTVLDEEDYARQFSLGDKNNFIVRLHGTPLSFSRNRTKPGLGVVTSRFARHPEWSLNW